MTLEIIRNIAENLGQCILIYLIIFVVVKALLYARDKVKNEKIKEIIQEAVKYAEMIGENKLNIASKKAAEVLNQHKINISDEELELIIESVVNDLQKQFELNKQIKSKDIID